MTIEQFVVKLIFNMYIFCFLGYIQQIILGLIQICVYSAFLRYVRYSCVEDYYILL